MSDPVLNAALDDLFQNHPEKVARIRATVATWHPMSSRAQELWRDAKRQYIRQQLAQAQSQT